MTPSDLLSAALHNLASLEHHVPKRDRPIYLVVAEQIEQARAMLQAEAREAAVRPWAWDD